MHNSSSNLGYRGVQGGSARGNEYDNSHIITLFVLVLLLHLAYSYLQENMDLPDLNYTPPAEDVDEMDEHVENEIEEM